MNKVNKIFQKHMMEMILLAICIVIAITAPGFFTVSNILGILRSAAFKGVIAFGMTMVIICGEIDLSISSTVAISGIIAGLVGRRLEAAGILPMETGIVLGGAFWVEGDGVDEDPVFIQGCGGEGLGR